MDEPEVAEGPENVMVEDETGYVSKFYISSRESRRTSNLSMIAYLSVQEKVSVQEKGSSSFRQ